MALIICALLLSSSGLAADAAPKDDAYHYMKNGVDDNLYNEWWHFDLAGNGTQLSLIYLLSDPENITSSRMLQVWAVVWEDDGEPIIGVRNSRGFGGDRNSPTFDLDQCGFSPEDGSGLKVWGTIESQGDKVPVSWDLSYKPAAEPWYAIPIQAHVGHLKGDWMKWLVYMPSANVTGSLILGNRSVPIEGTGYHDHCWGRWALDDPELLLTQASLPEEGFSLALMETSGEQKNAYLGVQLPGRIAAFSGKQIRLNVTDLAFDIREARSYPSAYEVEARNGDFSLNLMVRVQKSMPLAISYPPPLPGIVAFILPSEVQGVLRSKSGEEFQFDAAGFSAYSTLRLHPLFGRINSTDARNATVTAVNMRTGQRKMERASFDGWFSLDADYADYLADRKSPWVADGDRVLLSAGTDPGEGNASTISIDLKSERQRVDL